MTPIQNIPTFSPNGNQFKTLTLDPFAFVFNSFALGDVIAAVPVVKHMVENYYTTPESYLVVAKAAFRSLFPFVPDTNFRDYDQGVDSWKIPQGFAYGLINRKAQPGMTRLTPKHMHLGQFASLMLADRILPDQQLQYVSLDEVDISKFDLPLGKMVALVSTYRDVTRCWHSDEILKVAAWLKYRGFTPVFVGKTDMDPTARESVRPKSSLPDDVSNYGIDLRNKTTLPELATIFKYSRAVCGLDSGPIHLAGTTATDIVCGYTSVASEHRVPIRALGKTYAISPEIDCIGCESRWRSNFWNYEKCYYGHANCCRLMTADRFVNILNSIL